LGEKVSVKTTNGNPCKRKAKRRRSRRRNIIIIIIMVQQKVTHNMPEKAQKRRT
jgi:hypothetical protein